MQSFCFLLSLTYIDEQKLWKTIMYKTSDYLRNGVLYLNNIIRPHHKRLSTLMIYSTTKCQSRCKHCSIWQKAEEHLSLRMIKMIMASQCVTKNTVVGLEGGEFLVQGQPSQLYAIVELSRTSKGNRGSETVSSEPSVRLARWQQGNIQSHEGL